MSPIMDRRPEVVPAQSSKQDRQGNRHDVGMQVAKHETEKGELLNGVVYALIPSKGVDHAGRAEPPPELLGRPALGRGRGRSIESIDADPVVEALSRDGVGPHKLQNAFKVCGEPHQDRRRESSQHGIVPPNGLGTDDVVD